jgi:hypothetical protein
MLLKGMTFVVASIWATNMESSLFTQSKTLICVPHNVKMCKTLFLESFAQVVMKFNVKVSTFLFLEGFVKVAMKSRLW